MNPNLITVLTILAAVAQTHSKLLYYKVRQQPSSTAKEDLQASIKLLKTTPFHPSHSHKSVVRQSHAGVYAMSLKQDRNNIAYFLKMKVGGSKNLEFMIDSGIVIF
jgi:hypothetical protein